MVTLAGACADLGRIRSSTREQCLVSGGWKAGMKEEELTELIEELNKQAAWTPRRYRRRVILMTALGYSYFFTLLLLAFAILGVMVWLMISGGRWYVGMGKILGPVLIVVIAMLRSLWVTWPPPQGLPLERSQAPELFEMLDQLRAQLRCPKLHHVLLTGELNARAPQHPRFGPFGWYHNYLQIGLPLLLALPRPELEAILAHELGHIAAAHGRIRSWINRSWITWSRLGEALQEKKSKAHLLVKPFIYFFFPRYNAHAMVLARTDEYEVDEIAAEVVSERRLADALTRFYLAAKALEAFWPKLLELARTNPEPPADVYQRMQQFLGQPWSEIDAGLWLEDLLAQEEHIDDTHPCLPERLEALEQEPRLPQPMSRSAADELVVDIEQIMAELGKTWVQSIREVWQRKHQHLKSLLQQRNQLAARRQTGAASRDELLALAELIWELDGSAAAKPYFNELYNHNKQDAQVVQRFGELLVEEEHAQAPVLLGWAIRLDRGTTLDACRSLIQYYRRAGDYQQCDRWQRRATSYQQMLDLAEAERSTIWADDEYYPHGLTPEELKKVQQVLLPEHKILRAYLVRKRVLLQTDHGCFILGLLCTEDAEAAIIYRLRESLAYLGKLFILIPEEDDQRQRFAAVPGAMVMNR